MIHKYSLSVTFSNEPKLICLHTVKWFQVFLYNANNFIQYHLFARSQMVSNISMKH